MPQEPLLSISEASQMLGVSETALRQWTDEGKLKAFITPGGHRRYSRTELKRFMSSNHKKLGIKDLVVELEDTVQVHREIARTSLHTTSRYSQLDAEAQESLSRLGRGLLDVTIRYITEPSRREEIIKLVRDVGHSHGETLVRLGLPLTDAVEAFIRHRDPMMEAVTHLMRKREAHTGRVVEAIPLVARVLDEALVSLVAAYQQYYSEIQTDSTGGTPL
ncbi:MAG: helix-turn-helix domain-containing protein [Dehalococcoidales bacterium]